MDHFITRYVSQGCFFSRRSQMPLTDALAIHGILEHNFPPQRLLHSFTLLQQSDGHKNTKQRVCYVKTHPTGDKSCFRFKGQIDLSNPRFVRNQEYHQRCQLNKSTILSIVKQEHGFAEWAGNSNIYPGYPPGPVIYYVYKKYNLDHYLVKIIDTQDWKIENIVQLCELCNFSGEVEIYQTQIIKRWPVAFESPIDVTIYRETDLSGGCFIVEASKLNKTEDFFTQLGFDILAAKTT